MKIIRKHLLIGIILFTLCGGITLFIFNNPSALFNDRTLLFALQRMKNINLPVVWRAIHIKVTSPSFWDKKIDLQMENVCYGSNGSTIETCFDRLGLSFILNLKNLSPSLSDIDVVNLEGGHLKFSNSSENVKLALPVSISQIIDSTTFHLIHIKNLNWVRGSGGSNESSGTMSLDTVLERGQLVLKGVASSHSAKGDVSFKLEIRPEVDERTDSFRLSKCKYSAEISFDKEKKHFGGELIGTKLDHEIISELSFTADHFVPRAEKVKVSKCKVLALRKVPEDTTNISFDCRGNAEMSSSKASTMVFRVARELAFKFKGDLITPSFPPTPIEPFDAFLSAQFEPLKSEIIETHAALTLKIKGLPIESPEFWSVKSEFNLQSRIAKFSRLVQLLDSTPYAVFAPFHILDGSIELSAKGEVDRNGGNIPVKMETQLLSRNQTLETTSYGILSLDNSNLGP